jgi:hypothetical protein
VRLLGSPRRAELAEEAGEVGFEFAERSESWLAARDPREGQQEQQRLVRRALFAALPLSKVGVGSRVWHRL